MLRLLDQIRERVDDETWEVVAGIDVGLELGYENGRATALVEAQSASGPGNAAQALRGRLADLPARHAPGDRGDGSR